MYRKVEITRSALHAYKDGFTLARAQLITLGGDNRDSEFGDKIQGGLLDIIDELLKNIDLTLHAKDEVIGVES